MRGGVLGYMKVQALILVLLVPWLVHAEDYGGRLGSMALSGSDVQADLRVIPLKPGDLLTRENVRAAIQALYDTGRYSYVEVDTAPGAGGLTDLTFRVRPLFFFSTFKLD